MTDPSSRQESAGGPELSESERTETRPFKFRAFITYSHQDKKRGDWLHRERAVTLDSRRFRSVSKKNDLDLGES